MSRKLNRFVAAIGTAAANIISTRGLTEISPPSVTIQADFLAINGLAPQVIFAEQQNVVLANPLAVDTGGSIAAGTMVDSDFVALTPSIVWITSSRTRQSHSTAPSWA
jgi:hypothetical protein